LTLLNNLFEQYNLLLNRFGLADMKLCVVENYYLSVIFICIKEHATLWYHWHYTINEISIYSCLYSLRCFIYITGCNSCKSASIYSFWCCTFRIRIRSCLYEIEKQGIDDIIIIFKALVESCVFLGLQIEQLCTNWCANQSTFSLFSLYNKVKIKVRKHGFIVYNITSVQ